MPRQELNPGAVTGRTQVCRVPPLTRSHTIAGASVRSGSRRARLRHRPSVSIQSQQTRAVTRRGRLAAAMEVPALSGTTRNSLTCTDALSCPQCPVFAPAYVHMAPVTGCIPDRQQYGFAETLRLRESIRPPLPPGDRIVLVLQQIRARGAGQTVRHQGRLSSLVTVMPNADIVTLFRLIRQACRRVTMRPARDCRR